MLRILITGRTGQVGRELTRQLAPVGRVIALDRSQMDLGDPDSVRSAIRLALPDIIVNAAAYTAVDKAEAEPELAMRINAVAPGVTAEEAKRINALLVHYSTDYVYDGKHVQPYLEDDDPCPLSSYGRSKLEGERAIAAVGGAYLILRTSWIYSAQAPNFVLSMLKLGREKKELAVVDDQVGSPTWARALAAATAEILRQPALARRETGIFHLSAQGYVTRFQFARRIFAIAGEISPGATGSPELRPVSTAEYPLPAERPLNAATTKEKIKRAFGIEMPAWDDQLREFMTELLAGAKGR